MHSRIYILLLIVFIVPIVQPLEAQFSVGVNAGITRMKFSGDATNSYGRFKPDPGFSAALRTDYRISDALTISFQPGYSVLRSRYQVKNDSGTAVVDSTQMTLKSFSLPMHAVVWSENGRFFVLAGMQLDYTLAFESGVLKSPFSPPSSSSSSTYNVRDYNLYMQFGAGFIIPLGKPYLSFELRYSQGLLNLSQELVHVDTYLPRTKLTNVSFVVGLQFPLGSYSEKYQVKKRTK